MKLLQTSLIDVFEIYPNIISDHKGYTFESFNQKVLADIVGYDIVFVQDNEVYARRNVLQGLHYQLGHRQGKLIRVMQGEIFDVAVDLRKSSDNFCKWFGVTLSSDKHNQLWIPPCFAHGYLALQDSVISYKATDYHCDDCETVLRWDDETIDVHWPLERAPILSAKDTQGLGFKSVIVFD